MRENHFRMRAFTWILLTFLIVLILVILAPKISGITDKQTEILQGVGIFFALIVLIVGMLFIQSTNRRLAHLAKVAKAIGQGQYTMKASDNKEDAIGLLAQAINTMGDHIAQSVEKLEQQQQAVTKQHQQLQDEYQRQADFGSFLQSLNTVDINTIANHGLDYIMAAANAHIGQFYIYIEANKLVKIQEKGIDHQALKKFLPQQPSQGFIAEIINRKSQILLEDIDEKAFPLINLGFINAKLSFVGGWPLIFQDKILGVIVLASLQKFDQTHARFLQNIIDALANTLNNATTYKTVQQQAIKLEQANQELLEADKLRSEFVANMSHELRTPLNSIIGFSSVLSKNRQKTLSEKDLDFVEKIHRNGKHLLNLINDILDLSKIEAGRMDLIFETRKIENIVKEIVDMLHPQADNKNITLQLEIPQEPLPEVTTDGDKLKQVLINLIGNAIKFTHEGGITLKLIPEKQYLLIQIIDTGIGIPEEKLKIIFEPFRQADGGTTRKYGGTGLGLTITKSIVELLGGRIYVESEINKGTTFNVTLPLEYKERALEENTIEQNTTAVENAISTITSNLSHSNKPKVLIADDNSDARALLVNYIEELKCEAILASDGEQALYLAKTAKPDLITLDLMMPKIDGWETLKRLKADPQTAHIPVIIISIVAEKTRALVLGAVDAITKPIVHEELQSILKRSLYQKTSTHILVVDDNPDVWELFQNLLQDHVSEIRTAANGKQALEVLATYNADLIFLDLMMPEMDGLTFLRIIRSDEKLMHIPVVVVSAKQMTNEEKRELDMRVVQVMQKGDDNLEDHLLDILKQQLTHLS